MGTFEAEVGCDAAGAGVSVVFEVVGAAEFAQQDDGGDIAGEGCAGIAELPIGFTSVLRELVQVDGE